MKKLLLSLLASTIYTSTVSAQSCQQPPTCAEMGYTKSESDCTGKTTLKCPFDLSKVSCDEANQSWDMMGDPLTFKVNVTIDEGEYSTFVFSYGGNLIYLDCGNGSTPGTGSSATSDRGCIYRKSGEYIVKLYGAFHTISAPSLSDGTIQLLSFGSVGLKKIYKFCVKGQLPEIPSTVTDMSYAFENCNNLTGSIPELPSTVTNMSYAFHGCNKLTGSIPELPSNVTDISYAFLGCNKLTGSIPQLPSTITDMEDAFYNASKLTDTFQHYSTLPNLKSTSSAFYGTNITQTANPSWPSNSWNYDWSLDR